MATSTYRRFFAGRRKRPDGISRQLHKGRAAVRPLYFPAVFVIRFLNLLYPSFCIPFVLSSNFCRLLLYASPRAQNADGRLQDLAVLQRVRHFAFTLARRMKRRSNSHGALRDERFKKTLTGWFNGRATA
jgi:hypothetical protein